MRMTRIVRCLSLVGLDRLGVQLVVFLAAEVHREHTLDCYHHSLDNFWIPALPPPDQADVRRFIDDCTTTDHQR